MSVNQVKVLEAVKLVKEVMKEPGMAQSHLRLALTALLHLEAALKLKP